ncbi:hypothetical protein ABIA33_004825 [Streptacidiphilus sp. MAP12-16]|uniref:LppU/SCO3897 family protein n=1 Tax=Streptacidiphilus sp. MAP12-16 TaxID=3156300 RepID=UPI0035197741
MTYPPGNLPQGQSHQQSDSAQQSVQVATQTRPPHDNGFVGQAVSAGRNMATRVVVVLIVIGVVTGAGYIWKQMNGAPSTAAVGDCVQDSGSQNIKVVSCTDPKAGYKVVGKVDHVAEPSSDLQTTMICKPFAAATTAFWEGNSAGADGYILCLGPTHE